MLIFHNPAHTRHEGRSEMYRGRMVPCHEVPSRLGHILAELARRPMGEMRRPASTDLGLVRRVHASRHVEFLAGAWDEWLAMDPAHADVDLHPSVWPARGFRHNAAPLSFSGRLGLFSFDIGTPITSGTWEAASCGTACAIEAARAVGASSGGLRAAIAPKRWWSPWASTPSGATPFPVSACAAQTTCA